MAHVSTPKILIVGAGLGGLTLAQTLRSQGLDFEIFDRDVTRESRGQGWAVVLHGMIGPLQEISHPDAPPLETVSVTYEVNKPFELIGYDGYTGDRLFIAKESFIRANRKKLRAWLSTGINIQWNKKFIEYEVTEEGVTAYFDDGTTTKGDLLVGADGVSSKVRQQLYADDPLAVATIPCGLITGDVTLTREQCERQFAIANSLHMAFAAKDNFRLLNGLKGLEPDASAGECYWMLSFPDPAAMSSSFWPFTKTNEELLEYAKERIKVLRPEFRQLVELQDPARLRKPFVLRDCIPRQAPEGPVTLLGDAVHAMSFFQGEGAHHAMRDAFNLGTMLKEAGTEASTKTADLYSATLRSYEKEMVERGAEAVLRSRRAAEQVLPLMSDNLRSVS